jgi:hypothetical protein
VLKPVVQPAITVSATSAAILDNLISTSLDFKFDAGKIRHLLQMR